MVVSVLYMTFFFKPIKCMNTVWIAFLHNNFMIRKMSIKPSYFYVPFMSLYPRHNMANHETYRRQVLCIPYNDDNVDFTGISRMIYKTCPKIDDGVHLVSPRVS